LGTWSSPSLRTQRNGGCPSPTGLLRECKLPAAPGETEGAGPSTRWASEEDFFGARHMGPNETTGPSVPPGAGGNVTDAGGPGGTKGARPLPGVQKPPCLCRGVRAESSGSFWRWQGTHQRKKRKTSLPPFTLPCSARAYYRASQCSASTCGPPSSRSTALVVDPFSLCFIHLSKAL
jgi:hypothetical protein